MAGTLGDAVVEVGANTDNFRNDVKRGVDRGLGDAVDSSEREGRKAGQVGSAAMGGALLGGLSKFAGPIGAVFAGIEVLDFFKGSIGAASDLTESLNAVNVVYGDSADAILALGDASATTFGLAQKDVNGYAVQFSAFAKAIAGQGGDVAGTFEGILGRATDFASVMNLDVGTALEAFQSGLAGETEPLRAFGIDLSDAAITAFAAANGIGSATGELTEQEKILARHGALMEQTSQVQGDFANTADGVANQQRILSAQFGELQTKIGGAFLPVANEAVTWANEFVTGLLNGETGMEGLSGEMSNAAPFIDGIVSAFRDAWAVLQENVVPAFEAVGATMREDVIPAINEFLPVIQPVVEWLVSDFVNGVGAAFTFLGTLINGLLQIFGGLLTFLTGVFTGDWSKAWEGLKQIAQGVWTALQGAFKFLMDRLFGTATQKLAELGLTWGDVWNALRGVVIGALEGVVNGVRDRIGSVVGFVRSLPGQIVSAIGNLGGLLYGAGQNVVQGLIDGVYSYFSRLASAARAAAQKIRDFFPFSPAKEGPLSGSGSPDKSGQKVMEMLGEGLVSGSGGLQTALSTAVSPLSYSGVSQITAPAQTASRPSLTAQPSASGAAATVEVNQNFFGPTTSGGRLQEMTHTIRYATQSRTETVEGVAL